MPKQLIRVGHSPDPDDAFMFYALAHDKLDTGDYEFVHQLEDIETLNRRALNAELEVSAVSIHAYSLLTDKYALLPCGASMGDKYGPMVVARDRISIDDIRRCRLAVPGTLTTAFLALNLYVPGLSNYVVMPFDEILSAVESGAADAGLIIHEGQLTYASRGLKLIIDLGAWWSESTGLPLPLGGNVIRKDLGAKSMSAINRLLKQSIEYGLAHRDAALEHALKYGRDLDRKLADQFVGMYVNDWTIDYGPRGRKAVELLLQRGVEAGVVKGPVEVEFVD